MNAHAVASIAWNTWNTILETETTTGFQISETYPKALLTRHVRQIFVTNSNI